MARSQRTFCRSEAPRRGAARGARRRSCARARTCCRATNAANHARGRARVDVDTPSCTEKVTADTIESAPAFGGSRARRVAVTTFPRFFGKSPSFGESKKRAGRLVAVQVVLPHEKPTSMVRTFSHHASGKRHASGKDARASNNAARTILPRIIITTFDEKNTRTTTLLNTRAEVLAVRVRVLGGDARGRAVRLPVAPPA